MSDGTWLDQRMREEIRRFSCMCVNAQTEFSTGSMSGKGERRLQPEPIFSCSHHLDLLEFRTLDAKVRRHLYDLSWIDEVFAVRAKLFQGGAKFSASHALRNLEAESAFTILLILETEFTNYHCALFSRFQISGQELPGPCSPRNSVSNGYSLKTCFPLGILPRNVEDIRFDFACYHFQARQ